MTEGEECVRNDRCPENPPDYRAADTYIYWVRIMSINKLKAKLVQNYDAIISQSWNNLGGEVG